MFSRWKHIVFAVIVVTFSHHYCKVENHNRHIQHEYTDRYICATFFRAACTQAVTLNEVLKGQRELTLSLASSYWQVGWRCAHAHGWFNCVQPWLLPNDSVSLSTSDASNVVNIMRHRDRSVQLMPFYSLFTNCSQHVITPTFHFLHQKGKLHE